MKNRNELNWKDINLSPDMEDIYAYNLKESSGIEIPKVKNWKLRNESVRFKTSRIDSPYYKQPCEREKREDNSYIKSLNLMDEASHRDLQEEYSYYLGKTVEIFDMEGEPQYAGKRGVVDYVDSIGQLHGTWGGCALIPGVDDFKIIGSEKKTESNCKRVNRLRERNWKYHVPETLARNFALAIDRSETDYEEIRDAIKEVLEFVKESVGEDEFFEDSLLEDLEYADIEDDDSANFYINEMYDVLDGYNVWMEPAINFEEKRHTRKITRI